MDDDFDDLEREMLSVGRAVATAITADGGPGTDATGGTVTSLTEAVMGVTAGLVRIADAIERLADAVYDMTPRKT